jgi:F-type H+-transporting ATPase subunit delta
MTDEAAYVRAYARALLNAARLAAVVPDVQRDLAALLAALADSAELRRWFCRRVLASPARRTAEARERLAGLVSPMTLRLLLRMAAWNHLHLLPAVARRFELALRRLEGRRTARAVFAQPPAEASVAALRRTLEAGGAAELEVATDPALLAGLTVRIEDRVFDASLAGRLARLRQALIHPGRAPATA